jgi:DNA-binding NarL/FixJ family response regulator
MNPPLEDETVMAIRVLLVDDHKIVRDGLKSMLAKEADIEVVGEAVNGRDALKAVGPLSPDVVVMDVAMPDLNGIEATREIVADNPKVRVVALSMHSESRYISEMLAAGATGYLLKDCAFDELAAAILTVSAGRTFVSRGAADVVLQDYVRRVGAPPQETAAASRKAISPREREVLALIGEGLSTKEIAARLGLSVKTVETHRRQIMDKLGIYNIAGLIKYAVREGLASLED